MVHQLKIELLGTKPPVWRRVTFPSWASLQSLHDVIQVAFGWKDCHLHVFRDERKRTIGLAHDDDPFSIPTVDERTVSASDVLVKPGDRLDYTYDFGDNWEHRITLEADDRRAGDAEATCVGGRRNHPPEEDIGGVWGMAAVLRLLEAGESVDDGDLSMYAELVEHLREQGYDPACFDPEEVNARLRSVPVVEALDPDDEPDCSCPECTGDEGFELADPLPAVLPPITLPPVDVLAVEARRVRDLSTALRLARWCAPGRAVTKTQALKPVVARRAVEDLELWRDDPVYADDPILLEERLSSFRSAHDLEMLDPAWHVALGLGWIVINGKAIASTDLPDIDDDEAIVAAWREMFTQILAEHLEELTSEGGLLSSLPQLGAIAILILYGAYVNDGWFDVESVRQALADVAIGEDNFVVDVIVDQSLRTVLDACLGLGAIEIEGEFQDVAEDPAGVAAAGPRVPVSPSLTDVRRIRSTQLGRAGMRTFFQQMDVEAPVVGGYADADAMTLLDALAPYELKDAVTEFTEWLVGRDPAVAMKQVLQACAGVDPVGSQRRLVARVLCQLMDDEKAIGVLRAAAEGSAAGDSHLAIEVLRLRGELAGSGHPWPTAWMIIDGFVPATDAQGGVEILRDLLTEGPSLVEEVRANVDDLSRSEHPESRRVLESLAAAVKPMDNVLAKRLRKAAHKTRTRRRTR